MQKFAIRSTFILCFLVFSITINAQTISGELKKWHKITLEFTGPSSSETNATNPFSDYALQVNFIGANKTYTVPGYFAADGNAAETSATSGNKWHVHFTPPETGLWNYTVSFKQGTNVAINGGGTGVESIDDTYGSFDIADTDKTGDDLRAKGRVEYVGEHYLQYAETGEWFIKGGADAPENTLAYDDFDEVPNRANRRKSWAPHQQDYLASEASSYTWQNGKGSELLGVIRYLWSKGLNAWSFLTFSLAGDDHNVFPHLLKVNVNTYSGYTSIDDQWNLGVHHDRFDVSRLAQWERIFEYADTKGMYLHFKTQEYENDQRMDGGALGRERKLYYRELIARFSHHLALNWNVGEENQNTDAQRKQFADYLWNMDPYRNNVVIHTVPGEKNIVYTPLLGNQSEYTGLSLQTNNPTFNEVFSDVDEWVVKSRNAGKKWVVAVDEPGSGTLGIDVDPNDKDIVRAKVNWATFLAGGAGIEYYYGAETGCTDLTCQNHRTRAQKYTQLSHTLDFFQDHFQQYLPNVIEDRAITSATNDYVLSKPGVAYAVYSPDGATTNINLPAGDWSVQWYNPRTGVMTNIINDVAGQLIPPNNNDWVGLITQCTNKILFVRGGSGSGGFLDGGSDDQLADIYDYSTTNPNWGWGEFSNLLTGLGYEVEQVEETFVPNCGKCNGAIDFTNIDLDEYDLIVFGSNNALYRYEETGIAYVDAVENYIRTGGAALFLSDANFGSDWWDAPYSDQGFLDRFGWEMNQDAGTYAIDASEFLDPTHPILTNVTSFDGEGVSPITLVNNNIPGVTSTILARAEGSVRRNTGLYGGLGPIENITNNDAALIVATVDQGRIAGHYDRNTFFNLNGAGTNINRLSNMQYATNLVQWLTGGCAAQPVPINIPSTVQAEDFSSQSGTIQIEPTADTGGGSNIGFIQNGTYTKYDLNVTQAGTYDLCFRVASNSNGGTINVYFDGILKTSIPVTNTGGWQSWQTVIGSINLTAGVQTMTLEFTGGAGGLMNVNWVKFDNNADIYFQLVDANTDLVIRNLVQGETIDLTVDGTDLNIIAVTNGPVGSVRFGYDGNTNFITESVAPYALAGDSNGDYNSWTPTEGYHEITASSYQNSGATGALINSVTVGFFVIESCANNGQACNNAGIFLQLVDANTNIVIRNLVQGETIDLRVDGADLNIVAALANGPVGSVQFGYDGNTNFITENVAPHALAGDSNGNYNSWTPTVGFHTVTASAYQNSGASGALLGSVTNGFFVIESCAANDQTCNNAGIFLQLIDANTDGVIRNLVDGETIDLTIDGTDLNIVAALANGPVGSVRFGYDGNANFITENTAPHALAGDSNGNYNSWTPTVGFHTVTASAYQNSGASGAFLGSDTKGFYVIESCATIGQACNDADPCTVNDTFDASCNCAGTFTDTDNDGIANTCDNCPAISNTNQTDTNLNGSGDICETQCQPIHVLSGNYPSTSVLEFNAQNTIESSSQNESGSNISYEAVTRVQLKSGFKIEAGATFRAYNLGCTP